MRSVDKLDKELERLENELSRINIGLNKLNKKLRDKDFVTKAPKTVVQEVRDRLAQLQKQHQKTATHYYRIKDNAIEARQTEKN